MDDVEGFEREDYPLRAVACDVWDGHVFINLVRRARAAGDAARRSAGALRAVAHERAAAACTASTTTCRQLEADRAELQRVPALPGHPSAAQSDASLSRRRERAVDRDLLRRRDGIQGRRRDAERRRQAAAALLPGLGERRSRARELLRDLSELPADAASRLHGDDHDLAAGRRTARGWSREWHFHPDEIAKPGFVCEDAVEFWDRTNREDWAISERSYAGSLTRLQPGPYSNRETQLWEFDQFVLSRVSCTTKHGVTAD